MSGFALVVLSACGSDSPEAAGGPTLRDPAETVVTEPPPTEPISTTVSIAPGGLPFRSIAAAERPGEGPAEPSLFVVTQAPDLAAFEHFLLEADALQARQLDYTSEFLIAAFRGTEAMSGFPIAIRTVALEGGELQVIASVPTPSGGAVGQAVFTTAYHLVAVSRTDAPSPPAEGELVVENEAP